jgi:opacity protein-like surface antigen
MFGGGVLSRITNMRTNLSAPILVAALCGLFSDSAKAESPFYVRAALGPAIAENIDVSSDNLNVDKVTVDYGGSFALAGGWNLNRWLAVELESGAVLAHLDRFENQFNSASAHGTLIHVPMTANVVARYERPDGRWLAYVKGGLGGAAGHISMSAADEGIARADGTDWDITLAYRVGAGIGYRITKRWTVGIGYELFGVGDTEWHVSDESDDPLSFELGTARIHALQLFWKFQF